MRRLVITGGLAVALSFAAHAENWPNWRGNSTNGVSSERGLPAAWSDTQNIAWKASLRGMGISSPIVWQDQVIVTSQIGRGEWKEGPRLFQQGDAATAGERPLQGTAASDTNAPVTFVVSAFDRASGKSLWTYERAAEGDLPVVHEKHNLATASPTTDGERIYAWFGTGQIVALDMNGKLVWERNLGKEFGPFDINHGHGSSPVVYKDSVILQSYHPSASYLLSVDARTGRTRWKVDREEGTVSYSTPRVVEAAGGPELIVNSSLGLSAHNVSNGELLWHIEEANRFPIPVSVFHDGIIYASRGYRSGPYMAIRPGGRGNIADSHVVWRVATGAPYVSSLVYYEGLIYMVGDVGVLAVIDAETGERIYQERIGGVYSASPVAGDGKIYLFSEGGETVVLEAGRNPRILSRNRLSARQLGSPAVSGGRLFIRSDDALFAIGE
jgi:outer membrane protein assembly factor BamB